MGYAVATTAPTLPRMSAVGHDEPAGRAEVAEKRKRDARDEVDELLWLMSDAKGRRFMWRLLSKAGVYRSTYVQGSFDGTAFQEGKRSAGLELMTLVLQHCPGRFTEMQKEAKRNERSSTSS